MKSGDSLSLSGLDCDVIHFIPFLRLFICVQVKNVSGSVSLSRSKSFIGSPIHWLIWTSFCAYYQGIVFPVLIKGGVLPQMQLPRNTFADYLRRFNTVLVCVANG